MGIISALAGLKNDRRFIQITVPVQPGNSGGLLLGENGAVVGVVVGKLNAVAVAEATGDIPQNVNFAVSLGTLQSFLDTNSVTSWMTTARRKVLPTSRRRRPAILFYCNVGTELPRLRSDGRPNRWSARLSRLSGKIVDLHQCLQAQ
jgi:hypothetical protein